MVYVHMKIRKSTTLLRLFTYAANKPEEDARGEKNIYKPDTLKESGLVYTRKAIANVELRHEQ